MPDKPAAYDLDKLKEGLVHIEANIEAIKEALEQETKKREQYLQHIAEAQAILSMHGRKDLH